MVAFIKLESAEDLKTFMNMAWNCEDDVGVHTTDGKIADAKSVLGLMALDYSKPVQVVTENSKFIESLEKWRV
ncbi:HPr family phosphocarrier protein [Zongyangia hominis]|uniref:HPr family phosphocarrier protein n=1 Tax=Zongyangia hominis TaxID=2763677 RepID=A0A926IBS9_9FIRM|nr:HPr family phosphocarrier protein [Zongyangia hominis]MBC8570497.1 HPr family phosphocarrier protein [Zongyangia hominis]